jgi:hypothetical protein
MRPTWDWNDVEMIITGSRKDANNNHYSNFGLLAVMWSNQTGGKAWI